MRVLIITAYLASTALKREESRLLRTDDALITWWYVPLQRCSQLTPHSYGIHTNYLPDYVVLGGT